MKRAPTLAAIYAAELRVIQARRDTADALGRARVAMRASVAKPRLLIALAAGTAGLSAWWIAHRRQRRARVIAARTSVGTRQSLLSRLFKIFVAYQMQRLPSIVQQVGAAWRQHRAPVAQEMPDTDYSVTGVRH